MTWRACSAVARVGFMRRVPSRPVASHLRKRGPLPVGDRARQDMGQGCDVAKLIGDLLAGIVDWLAIEFAAVDGALGAHNVGASNIEAPGCHAKDKAKEGIAKVEHHEGLVIHVGGQHLAVEFTFLDAHARERRHPLGGADDHGQCVQPIDSHIVKRTTAWVGDRPG